MRPRVFRMAVSGGAILCLFAPMPTSAVHRSSADLFGWVGGVGGLLFSPVGEAISWLLAPTIGDAEAAAGRATSNAAIVFDSLLTRHENRIDELAAARISDAMEQLSRLSGDMVSELDAALRTRQDDMVAQLRREATRGIRQITIVGFAFNLDLLRRLLQVLAVVVLLAAFAKALPLGRMGPWVTVALGLTVSVALWWGANGYYAWRIDRQAQLYNSRYIEAMRSMRFSNALRALYALDALDPDNSRYQHRIDKTELLLDVFQRPSSYATASGLASVKDRIDKLESGARVLHEDDADPKIMAAFVTWQTGEDRLAELTAATLSAEALEAAVRNDSVPPPVLLPLAEHYLRTYLATPIPDELLERLAGLQADRGDGPAARGPVWPLARLRAVEERCDYAPAVKPDSATVDSLDSLSRYVEHAEAFIAPTRRLYTLFVAGVLELARGAEARGKSGATYLDVEPVGVDRAQLKAITDSAEATWAELMELIDPRGATAKESRIAALRLPFELMNEMRLWEDFARHDGVAWTRLPDPNSKALSCGLHQKREACGYYQAILRLMPSRSTQEELLDRSRLGDALGPVAYRRMRAELEERAEDAFVPLHVLFVPVAEELQWAEFEKAAPRGELPAWPTVPRPDGGAEFLARSAVHFCRDGSMRPDATCSEGSEWVSLAEASLEFASPAARYRMLKGESIRPLLGTRLLPVP